ncbi:MAG: tautomerase family protein [Nitrospinae bacterium]|nr:tautomerase family protein [Nitrospinota bacterium]
MPVVRISVRKGSFSPREKNEMLNAVHCALVEALKIPNHDRTQVLGEYEDFEIPPGKGEKYTLIEISMFSGRSKETKRALFGKIVENLEPIGIPPLEVFIVLNEQPRDNWGIRGGRQASDLDLGFKVDV